MGLKLPDLQPCPWCDGSAFIDIFYGTPYVEAHHTKKCRMRPNTWLLAAEPLHKQIEFWNRRPNK